jgi:hypothetical protein
MSAEIIKEQCKSGRMGTMRCMRIWKEHLHLRTVLVWIINGKACSRSTHDLSELFHFHRHQLSDRRATTTGLLHLRRKAEERPQGLSFWRLSTNPNSLSEMQSENRYHNLRRRSSSSPGSQVFGESKRMGLHLNKRHGSRLEQ